MTKAIVSKETSRNRINASFSVRLVFNGDYLRTHNTERTRGKLHRSLTSLRPQAAKWRDLLVFIYVS
jgi:hypothetical protein